ncbi:MAG: SLATT domain-containing protein, partial [Polyangiaceae bacterium]
MAPPSQAETDARRVLEGQLRECYGRVVYSHKTHEKCADILLARHSTIKVSQIVLSALTTAGFVSTFFDKTSAVGSVVGFAMSAMLLVLNSYTKDYDLGELAQKHKQAASEIWLVRENYLSLLTDLVSNAKPLDAIRGERDELTKALHTVYEGSPSTTHKAYRKAQDALQRHEDMTF